MFDVLVPVASEVAQPKLKASLFTDAQLDPTLDSLMGMAISILGVRGKGKSVTLARITEQFLYNGVPLAVVDILGEYWTLKEKFPNIIIVGRSSKVDVDVELSTTKQARKVAEWSFTERTPVVLDMSDYSDEQGFELIKAYFEALWPVAGRRPRPYFAVVDECHTWFPQRGTVPTKEIFSRIALKGRSRGLGIVMASQRSANVEKSIITQANFMFLHGVRHGADIGVYQDMVPAERAWTKSKATSLRPGEVIFVTDEIITVGKMMMRDTVHGGYTPGMEEIELPKLTSISEETLNAFKSMFSAAGEEVEEDDPTIALQQSIEALQADAVLQDEMLRQKDQIILDQQAEIERLSKIVVTMPEGAFILRAGMESAPISVNEAATAVHPFAAAEHAAPVAASGVHEGWAAERQMRRFKEMLEEIQSETELMHRLVMRYLLKNPDVECTLMSLANTVAYAPDTLRKNPPTRMFQRGLLQRRKINGFLNYTAKNTFAVLKEQYPNLDTQALIDQLVALD